MPPTTGHLDLIRFASHVDHPVRVIVCTQPHEPMPDERFKALEAAVYDMSGVSIAHFDRVIEQDSEAEGFWDEWQHIMVCEMQAGALDYIVASEPYGQELSNLCGATFIPYDLDRVLNPIKAERVRESPYYWFDKIIPEFQKYLKTTVTIFGAESTGKTTLSKTLWYRSARSGWLFEWARPYLEQVGPEPTLGAMHAIWHGQYALQMQGREIPEPLIVQDTDLFSTVGYWNQPHWRDALGWAPQALVNAAKHLQSDLYLITQSNIPFEEDPLRYGGDHREATDAYWISICEKHNLPYHILKSSDPDEREREAWDIVKDRMDAKASMLKYDRLGL